MARYTGPKHKLARREGINILEKSSQSLQRRVNVPPGVHGRRLKRRLSEFGLQLREKQKAKAVYGLLEKQFSNLVKAVQNKKGETGKMIIEILETRLDNIVYRLGFAKTRFMARQLVSHGHILVNGKKMTIPSYRVKQGDVISLSSKTTKNPHILKLLEEKTDVLPFLEKKAVVGTLKRMPTRADIQVPFDIQLIVEYYSR
ncbi:MAG: 30S ribosomal protein S4 [Candidatus Levybacteria bacterium RIFCSPHIGHO2_12_FULL_38_12]|nr:MAG: 30S ribosomal protein S4 [Candidatus Levybacteria bacterium RIFCSPHIGHO2_02_FULL_37_18]OGH23020.1 MAG: 30S ribosomal protein S4 [Candidatus Levybacteria bacterium RIFCSPHIGHO2_12_FULL_38_12]OGH33642.1 MAG: 30S ribosomal protein S4 [Candidatus Levybacteria bacterium RIFCSPLOWO2_01_FULL_37_20]OGH44547.1 MAG: 30S ribosomal protein S4 [Candidatus Levybacteria bacterium RIFCSPLOWO2_02_FULL_37_18]OGH51712.1 MAG: 30S ribosomal protein S4 [Candidatus Levybacteria bacterium RIFCSPLOWO2_12_FULL_3